jgi:hypothetical protein
VVSPAKQRQWRRLGSGLPKRIQELPVLLLALQAVLLQVARSTG